MNPTLDLPLLNPVELRVLGALIEKSKTTPDYYPMTLNSITAACNQKTSRHPVTNFEEEEVMQAITSLKAQSLFATAVGGGSRVLKYKHNFTTVFAIEPEELTVLCLLLLRGPQTPGEINTNSGRLFEFRSLEQVLHVIDKMMVVGYVKDLGKRTGQKETRYVHLLGEQVNWEEEPSLEKATKHNTELEVRVLTLEKELAEIKENLTRIMKELF